MASDNSAQSSPPRLRPSARASVVVSIKQVAGAAIMLAFMEVAIVVLVRPHAGETSIDIDALLNPGDSDAELRQALRNLLPGIAALALALRGLAWPRRAVPETESVQSVRREWLQRALDDAAREEAAHVLMMLLAVIYGVVVIDYGALVHRAGWPRIEIVLLSLQAALFFVVAAFPALVSEPENLSRSEYAMSLDRVNRRSVALGERFGGNVRAAWDAAAAPTPLSYIISCVKVFVTCVIPAPFLLTIAFMVTGVGGKMWWISLLFSEVFLHVVPVCAGVVFSVEAVVEDEGTARFLHKATAVFLTVLTSFYVLHSGVRAMVHVLVTDNHEAVIEVISFPAFIVFCAIGVAPVPSLVYVLLRHKRPESCILKWVLSDIEKIILWNVRESCKEDGEALKDLEGRPELLSEEERSAIVDLIVPRRKDGAPEPPFDFLADKLKLDLRVPQHRLPGGRGTPRPQAAPPSSDLDGGQVAEEDGAP